MKPAIFILCLLTILAQGCRKCYTCYSFEGRFSCVKGSDSIIVTTNTGKGTRDSLLFYKNAGYTCDTILVGYYLGPYNNRKCPDDLPERAYADLDSCTLDD